MNNRNYAFAIGTLFTLTALAGCASPGQGPSGNDMAESFVFTGSSTVYPVSQAWAEVFRETRADVDFKIESVGTGAGFQVFCRGEADVTGASRPIKTGEKSEDESCKAEGIDPFEIEIGIDALAVVVSTKNTFAEDISIAELHRIWTANASQQANTWRALRPEWPDEPIVRYGPGPNSGTFDYFVETVLHPVDGKTTKGRSDYTPSEDDNVLVQGISASPHAIGYFGLAYVHENADKVRALKVDGGKGEGPIEPTAVNVEGGKYAPLARPIFHYTDGKPAGTLQEFFRFGLGEEGQEVLADVGYIKLPSGKLTAMKAKVG